MTGPPPGGLPRPRKRFGQHFLTDPRVLGRIVEALAPTHADTVIEIGPGRGALTDLLADRVGRLVAIEIDRDLATHLRRRYEPRPSITILEADVLEVDLAAAAGGPFLLVANVPYYITTPILFHALHRPRPLRAVYLVQREVAERLGAAPGSRTYGALSVNVQAVARVEVLFTVPPGAFRPVPEVTSAVVRVTPRADPVVAPGDEAGFRAFVQRVFAQRRKQMRRVLRTVAALAPEAADRALASAGIDPAARPETLSPADFAAVLGATRVTS